MNNDDLPDSAVHDLFMHELQSMYYFENNLIDLLGEMRDGTTDDKIRDGFNSHQDETRQHVERLETVFDALNMDAEPEENAVINGLAQEQERMEAQIADEDVKDLFYIGAGIKTERIEISGYEHLLLLAQKLDLGDNVTSPLQENLESEEETLDQLQSMQSGSKVESLMDKVLP